MLLAVLYRRSRGHRRGSPLTTLGSMTRQRIAGRRWRPCLRNADHPSLQWSAEKYMLSGGAATHPGSSEPAVHPARPHRSVSTVEEYDPATNSWRARSSMPTARNHAAIGAVNNKIYVIGGRIGAAFVSVSSPTDVVEEYDPTTDQWGAIRARMPTPRSAVAWGVHGGRIYVAGGEAQAPQFMAAFRALEAYEPVANRWSSLPSMPIPRHGLAGAVLRDRPHLPGGDVQSAGIADMHLHDDSHDAFEFAER